MKVIICFLCVISGVLYCEINELNTKTDRYRVALKDRDDKIEYFKQRIIRTGE